MQCQFALIFGLLASPAMAQDIEYFQSPSGNIFCAIMSGDYAEARCDMRELMQSFRDPPADCDLEWGDSFAVGEQGPGALVCHGDTVMMPDAPVLEYGQSLSLGAFTCTSEQSGVTCTNGQDHGFTLSRARQDVF